MSVPIPHSQTAVRPLAEFVERHEPLRALMEWIADRFAEGPAVDDSIAWEDGEEHGDEAPPAA